MREAIRQRFSQVMKSRVKLIGKLLHNWLKKIIIHGRPYTNGSFRYCPHGRSFLTLHYEITRVYLWHYANTRYWYCYFIFVDCSCTHKFAQGHLHLWITTMSNNFLPSSIHSVACKKFTLCYARCIRRSCMGFYFFYYFLRYSGVNSLLLVLCTRCVSLLWSWYKLNRKSVYCMFVGSFTLTDRAWCLAALLTYR